MSSGIRGVKSSHKNAPIFFLSNTPRVHNFLIFLFRSFIFFKKKQANCRVTVAAAGLKQEQKNETGWIFKESFRDTLFT